MLNLYSSSREGSPCVSVFLVFRRRVCVSAGVLAPPEKDLSVQ